MNEQFFHDRAKTVRELAERADPHTKRRLLDLASRYEKKPRPPTPIPAVSSKDPSSKESPAKDAPLTSTMGLVEEILAIPSGGLSVLVDGYDDGVDMPVAPTLTSRLLADVVQGREKG
jgi:hypothetical protein